MSNLYQDAILDAKALRASAIANAKSALEEAFGPKIEAIVKQSLSEDMEEEAVEEIEEGWEEEGKEVEEGKTHDEAPVEESAEINEQELDEILNQLEEIESANESLNEAEEEEEKEEEEKEEEEGEEAPEGEEAEGEEEEEPTDETKVIDITLGDLKQVIQSLMPAAEAAPEEEEPTADSEAEEEVSLEEILDELEAEGMQEEGAEKLGQPSAKMTRSIETQGDKMFDRIEENKEESDAINEMDPAASLGIAAAGTAGIVGLSALIAKIQDYYKKNPKATGAAVMDALGKVGAGSAAGARKAPPTVGGPGELEEAKATIETLRKDLQEVNLLNAKYLYMNKLFKSNSLTEGQKVKIVNALDRATSVKEVKMTYQTISESFSKKKELVKESVGFASKPAGVAPKANIVESDQFINRWQKLAGIKK